MALGPTIKIVMTGQGPFVPVEMDGMFTVVKVCERWARGADKIRLGQTLSSDQVPTTIAHEEIWAVLAYLKSTWPDKIQIS